MPTIQSPKQYRHTEPEKSGTSPLSLGGKRKRFLRIEAVHKMPPFLVNLVSPKNQWIFINSLGALTAGRENADQALFPYCTDDKLEDLAETTGSVTFIRMPPSGNSAPSIWRPFSRKPEGLETIDRTLYKSPEGDEIILEERNRDLGLRFSCAWSFSSSYGFVRIIELKNLGRGRTTIHLLDGIQNLVPCGLGQAFLNRFSNLANAYKISELALPDSLGIYYLSSIPTDKAEPSESLKATVAWSLNYRQDHTLLSDRQMPAWLRGKAVRNETDIRGQRGAYILEKKLQLQTGESFSGLIVADVNQDAGTIETLRRELKNRDELLSSLAKDIQSGHAGIRQKISASDGYQTTSDRKRCRRHLSSVLFNIMRGGIFHDDYLIPRTDFLKYLNNANTLLYQKFSCLLESLPEKVQADALLRTVEKHGDSDLSRLVLEYLPLTFSRRHGDPSRPWNTFSIDTTDPEGNPIMAYQGNWRDIFQNWEALAYSYPKFLSGMIFRFLNASTADGYNPYRLTKDGFEWEELKQDEPWSNIGYWGDHQIVYLLKFLELSEKFQPGALSSLMNEPRFVYADLPYRIASFEAIWENPRETVRFDLSANEILQKQVEELGTDGKLLLADDGQPLNVTLLEKLLVPILTKLSNFVPEGGIWMNTQRPEWNDANNALAGNGLSVVTLGYMRRYLNFLISFLDESSVRCSGSISEAVHRFFMSQSSTLTTYAGLLAHPIADEDRYRITKMLGEAGSNYRQEVYENRLRGPRIEIGLNRLVEFLKTANASVEHSLKANSREDGLFHSYNLMRRSTNSIGIEHLYEMLEGQVSILSSQCLSPGTAVQLLDGLKRSKIFRPDKGSYMLYPDRKLPRFLDKNRIPEKESRKSPVIQHLLKSGDKRVCYRDIRGNIRFNSAFRNVEDLSKQLQILRDGLLADFSSDQIGEVGEIFETTFAHHAFTGRSGTFFAYEGLGSIYWHMVSKLLLAIQETYLIAAEAYPDRTVLDQLARHYYLTLEGLGIYDKPENYGAFPSDPYSHVPKHGGVQQPGMTGQVKEDILVRWGELGIRIEGGCLSFKPLLLRTSEFLTEPGRLDFHGLDGKRHSMELEPDQLAFTYCQVPIVYALGEAEHMKIALSDGSIEEQSSPLLSEELSDSLFSRSGKIGLIRVSIPRKQLRD